MIRRPRGEADHSPSGVEVKDARCCLSNYLGDFTFTLGLVITFPNC